jgi:PAS domain S-box-containing protein
MADVEDNEKALFASIELSPMATVITNPRLPDNPIVAVDHAFCGLTGYPREEVVGRNCRFLAGPETEASARAVLREAVAAARPALTEIINYRRDGTRFRNGVMISPLFGPKHLTVFLADAQRRGDLLIAPTAYHLVQDLALAQRKLADELLGPLSPQRPRQLCPLDDLHLPPPLRDRAHRLDCEPRK